VVDRPAGHGRHAHDRLDRLGQRGDARHEHATQRRRQPRGALVRPGHEQLLDEEWVAIRALVDARDLVGRRRRPADRGDQLAGPGEIQSRQLETLDPSGALQLGQPGQERVTSVELVGAEGHDQPDALVAKLADEIGDEVAGGRIGPVKVLDDDDDRLDGRQPTEGREDRLEQPGLLRRPVRGCIADRRSERRNEPGEVATGAVHDDLQRGRVEVADQAAQGVDDGPERQPAVADVGAPSGQDAHPARRRDRRQLGGQTRLPDAGLAGDEEVGRGPRQDPVERGGHDGELALPPDDGRADETSGHGVDHTGGSDAIGAENGRPAD
jgi:hypothetical protein